MIRSKGVFENSYEVSSTPCFASVYRLLRSFGVDPARPRCAEWTLGGPALRFPGKRCLQLGRVITSRTDDLSRHRFSVLCLALACLVLGWIELKTTIEVANSTLITTVGIANQS